MTTRTESLLNKWPAKQSLSIEAFQKAKTLKPASCVECGKHFKADPSIRVPPKRCKGCTTSKTKQDYFKYMKN